MEKQQILEGLMAIVDEHLGGRTGNIRYDAELSQLGLDSLEVSEIIAAIEETFDCVIRMDVFVKLKTLNDFADYIGDELK